MRRVLFPFEGGNLTKTIRKPSEFNFHNNLGTPRSVSHDAGQPFVSDARDKLNVQAGHSMPKPASDLDKLFLKQTKNEQNS